MQPRFIFKSNYRAQQQAWWRTTQPIGEYEQRRLQQESDWYDNVATQPTQPIVKPQRKPRHALREVTRWLLVVWLVSLLIVATWGAIVVLVWDDWATGYTLAIVDGACALLWILLWMVWVLFNVGRT